MIILRLYIQYNKNYILCQLVRGGKPLWLPLSFDYIFIFCVPLLTKLCLLCTYFVLHFTYIVNIGGNKMKEVDRKFDKFRCNLYLPVGIVEEVDKLAKTYGANRSVMISFILKTYLDQQAMVELSKQLPGNK